MFQSRPTSYIDALAGRGGVSSGLGRYGQASGLAVVPAVGSFAGQLSASQAMQIPQMQQLLNSSGVMQFLRAYGLA